MIDLRGNLPGRRIRSHIVTQILDESTESAIPSAKQRGIQSRRKVNEVLINVTLFIFTGLIIEIRVPGCVRDPRSKHRAGKVYADGPGFKLIG